MSSSPSSYPERRRSFRVVHQLVVLRILVTPLTQPTLLGVHPQGTSSLHSSRPEKSTLGESYYPYNRWSSLSTELRYPAATVATANRSTNRLTLDATVAVGAYSNVLSATLPNHRTEEAYSELLACSFVLFGVTGSIPKSVPDEYTFVDVADIDRHVQTP